MALYTLSSGSGTDFYSTANKFVLIVGLSALYRLQSNGCFRRRVWLPRGPFASAARLVTQQWNIRVNSSLLKTTMALSFAMKRPKREENPLAKMTRIRSH